MEKQLTSNRKLQYLYGDKIIIISNQMQTLLKLNNPDFYNAGIYGWNWSAQIVLSPHDNDYAIVYGCRNLPKGFPAYSSEYEFKDLESFMSVYGALNPAEADRSFPSDSKITIVESYSPEEIVASTVLGKLPEGFNCGNDLNKLISFHLKTTAQDLGFAFDYTEAEAITKFFYIKNSIG